MRERTETEVNPASQHSVPELFRAIRARRSSPLLAATVSNARGLGSYGANDFRARRDGLKFLGCSNSVAKAICRTNANHARTLALLKTKLSHKYTADPNSSISSRDRPCFARGKPFKHLEAECSRS